MNESLAEVYSIIVTLDALEKAYLKDSIADKEYTETCNRLLKQYKSNLQDGTVSSAFGNLESFMEDWEVSCPRRSSLAWAYTLCRWNVLGHEREYVLDYLQLLSNHLANLQIKDQNRQTQLSW